MPWQKVSRRRNRVNTSPLEAFLHFVEAHGSSPLDPEEGQNYSLSTSPPAGNASALGLKVPELGRGNRTPGMKLNYERESVYKYRGALHGDPQIPIGEIEHYGICMYPDEDWLLWLRAAVTNASSDPASGSAKKRVDRLADIQRLIKVVRRKVQEAVDHAAETGISSANRMCCRVVGRLISGPNVDWRSTPQVGASTTRMRTSSTTTGKNCWIGDGF